MNEVGNGSRHTPVEYLRCWIHRPAVYFNNETALLFFNLDFNKQKSPQSIFINCEPFCYYPLLWIHSHTNPPISSSNACVQKLRSHTSPISVYQLVIVTLSLLTAKL